MKKERQKLDIIGLRIKENGEVIALISKDGENNKREVDYSVLCDELGKKYKEKNKVQLSINSEVYVDDNNRRIKVAEVYKTYKGIGLVISINRDKLDYLDKVIRVLNKLIDYKYIWKMKLSISEVRKDDKLEISVDSEAKIDVTVDNEIRLIRISGYRVSLTNIKADIIEIDDGRLSRGTKLDCNKFRTTGNCHGIGRLYSSKINELDITADEEDSAMAGLFRAFVCSDYGVKKISVKCANKEEKEWTMFSNSALLGDMYEKEFHKRISIDKPQITIGRNFIKYFKGNKDLVLVDSNKFKEVNDRMKKLDTSVYLVEVVD